MQDVAATRPAGVSGTGMRQPSRDAVRQAMQRSMADDVMNAVVAAMLPLVVAEPRGTTDPDVRVVRGGLVWHAGHRAVAAADRHAPTDFFIGPAAPTGTASGPSESQAS